MRRLAVALRPTLALALAIVLAAHVGSPDVFRAGNAGPYAVDVVVRPPQVVPGIAEILVRVTDPRVERVTVRPVYWRAGSKGAPVADEAKPVKGAPGSFSGRLWLMAGGSYSVHVAVIGSAGQGTLVVPVVAVATGQLRLSTGLRIVLIALGTLLVAGVITAVHAAIGESQVPPGEPVPASRRRRARIGAAIATPLMALLIFGGAKWWDAEARAYARTLYRPMRTESSVSDSAGVPTLVLRVVDTTWRSRRVSPLMPDHGKLSHLFLARIDSAGVFVHLHPKLADDATLVSALPPLPAGRYRLFADVVHETGFQRTLVDSITLAAALAPSGVPQLDADDAWFEGPMAILPATRDVQLGDVVVSWAGDARPVAGATNVLRFALRGTMGDSVRVQPYLGMAGHAVVIRRDGGVYIHLHPSGTGAMASELAFALRDRGDTTTDGRLRLDGALMSMATEQTLGEIRFPYAFPSAGSYRVWVQLRVREVVRTAGWEVDVR
ncbi:MAG TPA: hypothetical protein VFS59_15710 [Gemmatimonadaceae bacterium]|nr:hypothetical protein [Gemmatimonadaceae bacterium]